MIRIKLVIADGDLDYLDGISRYIGRKYGHQFSIASFSNDMALEEYLNQASQADILMISPDMLKNGLRMETVKMICILSDGRTACDAIEYEAAKPLKTIDKFQSLERIKDMVLEMVTETLNDEIPLNSNGRKTKCISVFSVNGGTGKTTIAVAASALSCLSGNRVFYLNLEKISSCSAFYHCEQERGLSDIIYYIKNNRNNLGAKINALVRKEKRLGFDYFSPVENLEDIQALTHEEVKIFLKTLEQLGEYDYVFIDLSSTLDVTTREILMASDITLIVTLPGEAGLQKLEALKKQIRLCNSRNEKPFMSKEKTIVVNNRVSITEQSNSFQIIQLFDEPMDLEQNYMPIPFAAELDLANHMQERLRNLLSQKDNPFVIGIHKLLEAI